ncbi:hypothetical protein BDR22DRAFT_970160 [Usnea florida]
MLFMILCLNTALLLLIPITAIPIYSRALNPANLLSAYFSHLPFNLTNRPSKPHLPGYHQVSCFNTKLGLNLSAVAEDCANVLNDVISRLDGLSEKRVFLNQKYMSSNGRWVPARWTFGQCAVCARSGQSTSAELFKLLEVVLSANSILSDCVTSYRKGQGGFIPIGSREASYHVVLQGGLPNIEENTLSNADALALSNSRDSNQSLSKKRAMNTPTGFQPLTLDPSVSLNETLSLSISTGNLRVNVEHELNCFPRGSSLPAANEEDCRWIIDNIILAMKDPFREQTWGYTDAAENNISLQRYNWLFNRCRITVRNLDQEQVDSFRPVDVAEVAQRVVQACVVETKEPLGGTCDIGRLEIRESFYVLVSGTILGRGTSNNTFLSLPSNGLRALESRASLNSPREISLPILLTEGLNESHQAHCFDRSMSPPLEPASASDCDFVINNIILSLPNPMLEQTFGYTDDVDVNLSIDGNGRWTYEHCKVLITNRAKTTGRFRFLDVAYTAHRIMEQCIEGSKYGLGGTAKVGALDSRFFVGVGGIDQMDVGNGTRDLGFPINAPSSSDVVSGSPSRYGTDPADFAKRSSEIIEGSQASNELAPPVRCITPGMPAARQIDIQDCVNAAKLLLGDPNILVRQMFTTESTGGIRMPFVQNYNGCFLMVDTTLEFSVSEAFTMLKVVYWASAIMQKCVSGTKQGFGGVSQMDENRGIFVGVTGVSPSIVGDDLAGLSNQSLSAIRLKNTTTQMVDLGQS